MSSLALNENEDGCGLLAKLMATVRPEFRPEIVIPAPGSLVFNTEPCRIDKCERQRTVKGFCKSHYKRWLDQGRPELESFLASPGPLPVGDGPLAACTVTWCRFGSARRGLCVSHHGFFSRSSETDVIKWLATLSPEPVIERPECRLAFCDLWAQGNSPLCLNHKSRWHAIGTPDIDEFVARCESVGLDRFDFRCLADRPQLRLELQHALQCRHDERRASTRSSVVTPVIRLVSDSGVTSLLEWNLGQWAAFYSAGRVGRSHRHNGQLAFLRFAYTRLEDLAAGTGWESEYSRDVWALHRLGYTDTRGTLRFDKIPQPWLRTMAKRFIRWRLTSGREIIQARIDLLALNRFAAFLAHTIPHSDGPDCIDRGILERFLAELARDKRAVTSRGRDISSLNAFFAAIRRHDRAKDLPASANFYPEDFPRPAKRLPRALADHIMAQLDQPENLGKWTSPDSRLLTLILMRCGLRVGDACNLVSDGVVRDGDGAPYLRYMNRKMKREALVPLDEEVHTAILDQQRRVRERFPEGSNWLFPAPKMNPDGAKPLTTHSYRGQLEDWLERCDIRDEHGQEVRLTPHQWRHTFGTTLINRDVPQEVVRVLLDHTSAEMTAHYARLHDTTVRRHWEKARKVNINGDTITIDPQGPLAEASWAKQRLGRATQSLPNGFCGLPVQKTCPHANACLTCPMFVTTAEFLPQHQEQRRQTVQILSAAEARGQTRLIEMNQAVLHNLDRIIDSLDDTAPAEAAG